MTREELSLLTKIISDVQDATILACAADILLSSNNLDKEYRDIQKSARCYGDKWVSELEELTKTSLDELITISRGRSTRQ